MSITPSARTLIYARGKKGRRPAGDDIKHRSCELGDSTGSRALDGRPYRKTHDRPGFRGLSPSYGSGPGLGKNALAACGPRRARRVPRHDCAVGTARIRYRMGALIEWQICGMWRKNCPVCKHPMEKKNPTDTLPYTCGK